MPIFFGRYKVLSKSAENIEFQTTLRCPLYYLATIVNALRQETQP